MARKRIRKNAYKKNSAGKVANGKKLFLLWVKSMAVIFALGLMGIIFILVYDLITQCDYFRIRSVHITGTSRLTQEQVADLAEISEEKNILSINLSTARLNLISHPWIDEANIRRELPSKLIVNISEHTPLAVLDTGRKFLINTRGEIFKESVPADTDGLPVITGLDYSDLNIPDEPRSIPFSAVMDLLELERNPKKALRGFTVKRIHVDREIGLTLFSEAQVKAIRLGYNDYINKYSCLNNILFYLKSNNVFPGVELIDLKNSSRIVVRPAITETAVNKKEVHDART